MRYHRRVRYRLNVEYQGTRYHGWQEQTNARTVQGELLRAARELLGREAVLAGSGRTDAGVHAIGQVAHLESRRELAVDAVRAGLNDLLPADINVLEARRAGPRFHARHDAVGRSYLYQVSRRRAALAKAFVWWVKDPLDAGAMRSAATWLPGMRDCAGFADRRIEQGASTLVKIDQVEVAECGDLILIRLRASHFLWKMVRRVVGCLVGVGRREISEAQFAGLFSTPSPSPAPSPYPARVTAPPSGLFLEEVVYPGESFGRPLEPAVPVPSAVPPATSRDGRSGGR